MCSFSIAIPPIHHRDTTTSCSNLQIKRSQTNLKISIRSFLCLDFFEENGETILTHESYVKQGMRDRRILFPRIYDLVHSFEGSKEFCHSFP